MTRADVLAEILIVDDDDRIVELVAWFLKKRGYRVRSAQSFGEARRAIAAGRPDLMLSDIDLGAESALEELPRMQAAGALPPTLVVSGYLDAQATGELSRIAPVLDTLAKPFDFAVLEERVRSCLARIEAGDVSPAQGAPAVGAPAVGAPAVGAPAVGAPAVGAPAVGAPRAGSEGAAAPGEAPGEEDPEGWIEITPASRATPGRVRERWEVDAP